MGMIMDLDAVEWLNAILTDFDWFLMKKSTQTITCRGFIMF